MVIERKGPFRFVSRSVPFISFSSVSFRFIAFHSVSLRSIPFTTCTPLQLKFSYLRYKNCSRIFDATLSATRGPVQFNLRDFSIRAVQPISYPWPSAVQPSRLLHTRCSANLLPVARCSSTDVRDFSIPAVV